MSDQVLRVGIIGLGGMGHQHMLTCRAGSGVEVVAGCDVSPDQRARWIETFQVPAASVYETYEEMLAQEQLDVVIVATHANAHRDPVVAAAHHNVHVFCEKPLALSLREADEMVDACEAAGVKLAVNHIKRGSRGSQIARQLLDDGLIGQPYLVRGEAKGRRWAGSELMEMGTHLFDWLRALFGNPRWLFADITQSGRPAVASDIIHSLELPYKERDCGLVLGERAFCSLALPNGIHADVGFLSQPTMDDVGYGFDICGTEGTIALRRSVGSKVFVQRGYHRGPLDAQPWEQILFDEREGISLAAELLPDGVNDTRACQWRLFNTFMQAIRADHEPESSGRDGRAALELVMAVWQSHREGKPVTFPLPSREHPLQSWLDSTQ